MVTKRQLGFILVLAGLGLLILTALIDVVRPSTGSGAGVFGPYQTLGLSTGVTLILIGATLIPLGDRPA